MKVILARHGDAINGTGKFHGMIDTALTSKGITEAHKLAQDLKKYNASEIISSPMKRAMQTAEVLGKELGIPVKANNALLPLDLGSFVGKPTDTYTNQLKPYLSQPDKKIPQGEAVNSWAQRFIPFINKFVFNKSSDKTVIIVTHGRNILLTKADIKLGNNTKFDESVLTSSDKSTEHGGYAIVDNGKFEIITPKLVQAGQS